MTYDPHKGRSAKLVPVGIPPGVYQGEASGALVTFGDTLGNVNVVQLDDGLMVKGINVPCEVTFTTEGEFWVKF